jgi:hypothetical protein
MIFNRHSDLVGKHAFLSASKYHWVRYTDEKLDDTFRNHQAAQRGSDLHALAAELIRLKVKLPNTKQTMNMYVNDALGFRMTPEQILFVSYNCFGTADAISFKKNLLRIHDLKTGVNAASLTQLRIYAAMFCIEYGVNPADIRIELRIYQNDEIEVDKPEPEEIQEIMATILTFDRRIDVLKLEEEAA